MNLKTALIKGLREGIETTWRLAKLILSIFFAVAILKYTLLLPCIAQLFNSMFGLVGLSGETALALTIVTFVNIYAAIAVLIPLIPPLLLDIKQQTMLASMCCICHSIPISVVSHNHLLILGGNYLRSCLRGWADHLIVQAGEISTKESHFIYTVSGDYLEPLPITP